MIECPITSRRTRVSVTCGSETANDVPMQNEKYAKS